MNSTVIHTTEDQFATAVTQLASIPEEQWATIELSGKISASRFKELGILLGKAPYSCHLCFDCRNVTGFMQIPSGTFDDFAAYRGKKRIDVFAAGSAIQKVQGDLPSHGCFVISQLDICPDLLQFIKEGDLMSQLVFTDDMWLTSDGKVLLECEKKDTEITVPDSVEKIAPWALPDSGSSSVCIVHLPDSVHELPQLRYPKNFRFITGNFDELCNTPDYVVWDAATEPVCRKVDDNLSYWTSKDGTIFYLAQTRGIGYFQVPDGVKTISKEAGFFGAVEYPDSVEKAYSYVDTGVTICNTNLMPAGDDKHRFWDKAKGPHYKKADDEQSSIWISKDGTHLFRYAVGEEVKNAVIPEGVVTIEPYCIKTAGWRSKLNLVTLAESVSEDTRRSLALEECFLWDSRTSQRNEMVYITGLPRIEGNFLKDAAPSDFGNGRKKEYDAFVKSAAFSAVFEGIPKPVIRYYFHTEFEVLPEKLFEEWPELKDVRAASKGLTKKSKEAAGTSAKADGTKTAAATVQESITDTEWIIDAKKLVEAEYAPENYSGKTFTLKPLNLSVKANLKRLSQWLHKLGDMEEESSPTVTLDFSVSGITELPESAGLCVYGFKQLIFPEGFTRIEDGSLIGSVKSIVYLPDSMEFISSGSSFYREIIWASDNEEFRKNPKLRVVPKKTKPYYKELMGGAGLIISEDDSIVYAIKNSKTNDPIYLPQTVKSIELLFNSYTKDVYCPDSLEQFQDAAETAEDITFFSDKRELFPEEYTVFPSDAVFENGLCLNADKTVVYAIRIGFAEDIVLPETVTSFSKEALSEITKNSLGGYYEYKTILKNASLLDENTVQVLGDEAYIFGLGNRYTKNNLARLKETIWPGTNTRNKPPKLFSDVRRSKELTALFDGVPYIVAYRYFQGMMKARMLDITQYYPQLMDVQRILAKKEKVQEIQNTAAKVMRDASATDFTGNELTCSYQELLLTNLKSTADTFKLTLTGKMKNVDIENVFKFFEPFNGAVELDLTGVTGLTTFRNTNWPDYIEKLKFPAGVTNTGKFDYWYSKIKEILLPSTMETLDNTDIPEKVLAWSENETLTNNYYRVFRPGYRKIDEKGFVINTLRNALVGYEGPESEDTTLVLPAVETILDFSYPSPEKITEAVFPEGVKCIKEGAFLGGTYINLNFIKMPSSLETIEDYAIADSAVIEVPDSFNGHPSGIGPIISGNPELIAKPDYYLIVWDKSREPYCSEEGIWISKDGKHLFGFLGGRYQNCSLYNQEENKLTLPQGLESMEKKAIYSIPGKGVIAEFPETFSNYDNLRFYTGLIVIVNEPDNLKSTESWKKYSDHIWEKGTYRTKEGFWLSKDGKTLYWCDAEGPEITIPDGVTHVTKKAFSYVESYDILHRLSFPSSIEFVEDIGNLMGFLDVPGSKFPENYIGYPGAYIRGIRCAPDCNFVDVLGWDEYWDSSRKPKFRKYRENEKFRKVFTGIPEHVIRYWAKNNVEDFCEEFKQDWPQLLDVEGAASKL